MCNDKDTGECQFPERLEGKPEECSPEQIEACHGKEPRHPCVDIMEKE